MKYGINTFLWTANFDESHLELLPRIKEGGFDGVEIARFSFHDCPAGKIRRAIEANGLECTFCTALTGQMSLATDAQGKTLVYLKDAIQWAAEAGAKVVAGPFCSAVGYLPGRRRTDDEWARCIEGVRALVPTLAETGVTLAVEPLNRFETFFLNTCEDARALCEAVNDPRVGVLFDTFHANIEEKNISSGLATLGRHLKHVHTCENDRGTPGSGHVAWPELFASLRREGYDGWLVIESFGFAIKEIAAAACIWRDLAASPEAIAFEGVRFLRAAAGG
jgi:D-psicose/D-tagatose/L-ribulose 3-epimerase